MEPLRKLNDYIFKYLPVTKLLLIFISAFWTMFEYVLQWTNEKVFRNFSDIVL